MGFLHLLHTQIEIQIDRETDIGIQTQRHAEVQPAISKTVVYLCKLSTAFAHIV